MLEWKDKGIIWICMEIYIKKSLQESNLEEIYFYYKIVNY